MIEREYCWKQFDDCYGFSNETRLKFAIYHWLPRFVLYINSGISYRLEGPLSPEDEGFNVFQFQQVERKGPLSVLEMIIGEHVENIVRVQGILLRDMNAEEIEQHLREFKESMKYWNEDMKVTDEHNAHPTYLHMANLYRSLFQHELIRSSLNQWEKSRIELLKEELLPQIIKK